VLKKEAYVSKSAKGPVRSSPPACRDGKHRLGEGRKNQGEVYGKKRAQGWISTQGSRRSVGEGDPWRQGRTVKQKEKITLVHHNGRLTEENQAALPGSQVHLKQRGTREKKVIHELCNGMSPKKHIKRPWGAGDKTKSR